MGDPGREDCSYQRYGPPERFNGVQVIGGVKLRSNDFGNGVGVFRVETMLCRRLAAVNETFILAGGSPTFTLLLAALAFRCALHRRLLPLTLPTGGFLDHSGRFYPIDIDGFYIHEVSIF